MKAVQFYNYGNPDVLIYEDIDEPNLGTNEVLIKVSKAGVNFSDIYQRSGVNPVSNLPYVLGQEGAGIVVASKNNVFKVGDRVAWISSNGSYAEYIKISDHRIVHIPDDISDDLAASCLMQGITAQYLSTSTYQVNDKTIAFVHAGAGGVGSILIQLLKNKGAKVITTVSSYKKIPLAQSLGADLIIQTDIEDFVQKTRDYTNGKGVDIVYDSIGLTTYERSISLVRPLGTFVLFGQSSGKVPPIDPMLFSKQGSIFFTRPTLATHIAKQEEFQKRALEVFEYIRNKKINITISRMFPLEQAVDAHRALESRETTGKIILTVK
ncbi:MULTISPECIES: quinone oxidoreductase family protein [Acinetobacter calcoaceticus/baumannii complex]|uniref:quinone oxidoreductase family protein n=1 Tax=Acinetobacter calcoaceticus/baumannii complex TaxID=909768 RepID=UPI002446DAA4|nr:MULTISPECIES: quinone oxidoreductase [Acinetobacter calcoaceticus/baumannii complex]MDH2544572.1 quinone oxidoreductase [Acinetobacter baumannii]MDO7218886.1 quinone oxidoreductase [Acinetobacter nosocomialis]